MRGYIMQLKKIIRISTSKLKNKNLSHILFYAIIKYKNFKFF